MNAPGTRWWWHGDHRDSQGCTATPPLCPWLTHPVRSESSKCVLSRHKYYFIIVPWPAPTVPTWEELSACLKSRGLWMIKGRCLYRMSLMFFWQEPSIVTVYGLLSVRSAVAARWTAVGPAAPERHMYGGPERNPSTTGCSVCGKQQEDCETTHSASSGHDSRQAFFFVFFHCANLSLHLQLAMFGPNNNGAARSFWCRSSRACHAKRFELRPQNVLFSLSAEREREERACKRCVPGPDKPLQTLNTQRARVIITPGQQKNSGVLYAGLKFRTAARSTV